MIKASLVLPLFIALSHSVVNAKSETGVFGDLQFSHASTHHRGARQTGVVVGTKIGYKTESYGGVSATATLYSSQLLSGLDNHFPLNAEANSYAVLGEAYLQLNLEHTVMAIGRQEVETPFADTNYTGLIPNTFESVVIKNTSLVNTTLSASHLQRWAGIDVENNADKFTSLNDSEGVTVIGGVYEKSDKWSTQLWYYHAKGSTDMTYLESTVAPIDNTLMSIQYAQQSNEGGIGKVWGGSAEYSLGGLTVSAAHNTVFDGEVSNGFGEGPYFTSAEEKAIDGSVNQQATALGVEYTTLNHLRLSAKKVNFKQGANELDLALHYAIKKNMTVDFIYSDLSKDGSFTKAYLNYSF